MKKIEALILAAIIIVGFILLWPSDVESSEETGQYCEANPSACAVDRTQSSPNELETPAQIDWDNEPIYEHGGQPPKNAK